ncbi:MAG: prohibitin family protein [Anaerolineae bacterium]|jgi:regulator of protease activity HflC (stomatin/prohibitin superfamily)
MNQLTMAFFLSLLSGFFVGGLVYANTKRMYRNMRRPAWTGLIVFFLVLALQSAAASAVQVEAGTVAVVKQFGRVITVFHPGLNFKIPFVQETVVYRTQEIIYETSAQPSSSTADYPDVEVDTATSDGQQISARFTVRFRVDGNSASKILINLGTEREMVEKVVKANARVRVRNILKRFQAADLYSGDVETAETAIDKKLTEDYEAEGIELVFFGLRSIGFTEDYKNAVEEKQIEAERITTRENQALQAEYEKDRTITAAEAEAERQRLERIGIAQGQAESIKLQAEAEAAAILAKAQAQAEANRLISESLTPDVITWQAAINWNGQYPMVLGGSGQQYILPGELFVRPQDEASSQP